MAKKFAVFASGNGSNLQAIIDAVKAGTIKADLALVFSDRAQAYALERARRAGIEVFHLDPKTFPDKSSFEKAIGKVLKEKGIDFLVLAGYMRLLGETLLNAYPDKILNIHPALLPLFKGMTAIKDAYESKVKTTGVTVHFVDEKTDNGPIILQESVAIGASDTLETLEVKIHGVEHTIYPRAIALFTEDKIKITGRKVEINA